MTPAEFRRIALALPEAVEQEHMNHPDFRVGGKIFATLGGKGPGTGMVKLTPVQQKRFLAEHPGSFELAAGAWGRGGATLVRLADARKSAVLDALEMAWRNTAPAKLVRAYDDR
jgi:hypothetical protein